MKYGNRKSHHKLSGLDQLSENANRLKDLSFWRPHIASINERSQNSTKKRNVKITLPKFKFMDEIK